MEYHPVIVPGLYEGLEVPAVIGMEGSRAITIVPMFVSSCTFFHDSSGTDVITGVVVDVVVPVKTGVVFPVVGDGVEGCPVVHPAAIRSAARTMPKMRIHLADDI
jgi:hypothetical protein